MRSGRLFASLLLLAVACGNSGSIDESPDGIHPQPQPTNGNIKIDAPCNTTTCGPAPSSFQYPKCRPQSGACTWIDQVAVSYQACEPVECGPAPTTNVCPTGTSFASNTCGSENDDSCRWTTACAPPRSTTPCPDPNGPNGCPSEVESIGVICKDGSNGALACYLLASGKCGYQPNCE